MMQLAAMRCRALAFCRARTAASPAATRVLRNFHHFVNEQPSTAWALLGRSNRSGPIHGDPVTHGRGTLCQFRWYSASGDTSCSSIPDDSGKVGGLVVKGTRGDADTDPKAVQAEELEGVKARIDDAELNIRWLDGDVRDGEEKRATGLLGRQRDWRSEKKRVEGELATVAKQIVAVGDEIVEVVTETKWLQGMIADVDKARAKQWLKYVASPDKQLELWNKKEVQLRHDRGVLLKERENLRALELLLGPGVREQLLAQIEQLRKKEGQLRTEKHQIAAAVIPGYGTVGLDRAIKFRKAAIALTTGIPRVKDGEVGKIVELPCLPLFSEPKTTRTRPEGDQRVAPKTFDTPTMVELMVRKCHAHLADEIDTLWSAGIMNIVVGGTPGIGKSMFGLQRLAALLHNQAKPGNKFDVVYQVKAAESATDMTVHTWAFRSDGTTMFWGFRKTPHANEMVFALKGGDYYLCDNVLPTGTADGVVTILFSSPASTALFSWDKVYCPSFIMMDLFSEAELFFLKRTCYSDALKHVSDDLFRFVIATFGYAPRLVMQGSHSVASFRLRCQFLLRAATDKVKTNLANVAVRRDVTDTDRLSHRLFHCIPHPTKWNEPLSIIRPASMFAWKLVLAELNEARAVQFDMAVDSGSLNQPLGIPFEEAAVDMLSSGKPYSFRILRAVKRSSDRGMQRDNYDSVAFEDRTVYDAVKTEFCTPEGLSALAARYNDFIVPPKRFAAFDAISADGLFQCTVSAKKKLPGGNTGKEEPSLPVGQREMTKEQAWWYVPRLWCEMNSAANGHDLSKWAKGGKVVIPIYFVVPSVQRAGVVLEGQRIDEEKEYQREEYDKILENFEFERALPGSMTFKDVGEHNVTVTATFVAHVLRTPRMLSWSKRQKTADDVVNEQVKAYVEISKGKPVSNKSIRVVLPEHIYPTGNDVV